MRLKQRASQIDCLGHKPKVQGWQGCSNQREPSAFNPILSSVALPKSGGKSDHHLVYASSRYFNLLFLLNADYVGGAIKKRDSKKIMKWKQSLKKQTNKKITKGDGNKNVTNH